MEGSREVSDIAAASIESVERAGSTLSLPSVTALTRTIHERVGRIVDEREEAITDAMELDRIRQESLRRRTFVLARDAITRARTWALRREVEGGGA